MRTIANVTRILILGSALIVPSAATAGALEDLLDNIEVTARADVGSYKSDLSVTFGVSGRKVDALFEVTNRPSDVYMFLRIGQVTGVPVDRVVEVYREHEGQGWGAIAKSLGIQPGSAEFHALKEGKLAGHGGGFPASKGKGRGKGRQ